MLLVDTSATPSLYDNWRFTFSSLVLDELLIDVLFVFTDESVIIPDELANEDDDEDDE